MNTKKTAECIFVPKGLENVAVDETAISTELPEESLLLYRGYSLPQIIRAGRWKFLDIMWMLWRGELPSIEQSQMMASVETGFRPLHPRVKALLASCPENIHPMTLLRLILDILPSPELDNNCLNLSRTETDALFALSQIPSGLAFHAQLFNHQEPPVQEGDQELATYLLDLLSDSPSSNSQHRLRASAALNSLMISYAENAFAPSTFTARVVSSSLADTFAALSSAVASLSGPLHGGANEQVFHLLTELQNAPDPIQALQNKILLKERIMGFGHRVFRSGDPRVKPLFETISTLNSDTERVPTSSTMSQVSEMVMEFIAREKGLLPNVDFPAAQLLYLLGFPVKLFTPIFALSRIAGWSAHIQEQRSNNKLYNPRGKYVGKPFRHFS